MEIKSGRFIVSSILFCPTKIELNAENLSWSQNNAIGAYNSPLKFPSPGIRSYLNGALIGVGGGGFIWSDEGFITGTSSALDVNGNLNSNRRASGQTVRCIKN